MNIEKLMSNWMNIMNIVEQMTETEVSCVCGMMTDYAAARNGVSTSDYLKDTMLPVIAEVNDVCGDMALA